VAGTRHKASKVGRGPRSHPRGGGRPWVRVGCVASPAVAPAGCPQGRDHRTGRTQEIAAGARQGTGRG
jgi:hypothetical protein